MSRPPRIAWLLLSFAAPMFAAPASSIQPLAGASELVFEERDGVVVIEAEHFQKQTLTDKRAFHLVTAQPLPRIVPDLDGPHVKHASGGAYLEILPDTRATSEQKLIAGENFSDKPGVAATLHYSVHFNTPGRYHVWCRTFSTGTEDNGVHVGLDGTWPESGQRWQTTQKHVWAWDCRQRTAKNHGGDPLQLYLDVTTTGLHEIAFTMREDGFELDQWALALDRAFTPTGTVPISAPRHGALPPPFPVPENYVEASPKAAPPPVRRQFTGLALNSQDFPVEGTGYYRDQSRWLAINPAKNKAASTQLRFGHPAGRYDVTLHCVGESDGRATFEVSVGERQVGTFECPLSTETFEEGRKFEVTWTDVALAPDDLIRVSSRIASEDGKEFSRARWIGLTFKPRAANATTPALR